MIGSSHAMKSKDTWKTSSLSRSNRRFMRLRLRLRLRNTEGEKEEPGPTGNRIRFHEQRDTPDGFHFRFPFGPIPWLERPTSLAGIWDVEPEKPMGRDLVRNSFMQNQLGRIQRFSMPQEQEPCHHKYWLATWKAFASFSLNGLYVRSPERANRRKAMETSQTIHLPTQRQEAVPRGPTAERQWRLRGKSIGVPKTRCSPERANRRKAMETQP